MVCTLSPRIRNAIREVGKVFKILTIYSIDSLKLLKTLSHDAFNDPEIMADFKEYLNTHAGIISHKW